jgi:hypothetical protein
MLRENKSLETLSMLRRDARFEDYLGFVAAIQPNTTLKRVRLQPTYADEICMDEDEMKHLVSVLKKNYELEESLGLDHGAGNISSILQLNRAGRRYLVQDGSSISKGVDVLSRVNNNINSVFLHLLENPRLCDRSAVEMPSIMDSARPTSPGNHSCGKREQEVSQGSPQATCMSILCRKGKPSESLVEGTDLSILYMVSLHLQFLGQ